MKKPAYRIKIGSNTFDSSQSPEIITIAVDLDLKVPADSFTISLKPGAKANAIKNGDPVIIELGFDEDLFKVLTGAVDSIERKISEVLVRGLSVVSLLTRTRVNQVYEKQTAGAIVQDLAKRAGLSVKKAEDGLSFPMYAIDDTKDCYTHMKELAGKCGFDLFLTPEGWVMFKRYARQTPKPFKFGRDIIQAEMDTPMATAYGVKVYGESPSSFKGAGTAHWLTKKVVEGVTGNAQEFMVIEDPVIKDRDTADKVATAVLESILVPFSGSVTTLGNARIGLGDTIEIQEMPDVNMNGEFEVTSVHHVFSKDEGFVSITGWVKKITISKSEPPLSAPPPAPAMAKPPSPLEEMLESAKGQLEEKRLQLQDAVENAEMKIEQSSNEINSAIAAQDTIAKDMIAAAEDAMKTAKESANTMRGKAEELKKGLEAKKKEIETAAAEAQAKFEEYQKTVKAEVEKNKQQLMTFKGEAEKIAAEGEKKISEAKKSVESRINKLDDEKGKITSKAEELKKTLAENQQKITAKKEELTGLTGPAREAAEKQVRDLASKINEAKEKEKSIQNEIEEKEKESTRLKQEMEQESEKISKEVKDKKADIDAKVQEAEAKGQEIKKESDEVEKNIKESAGATKKKLEDALKEGDAQIEEANKAAEKIEKEATEKLAESRKKAEDAKKQAIEKLESVKKTYAETRNKVMDMKNQMGF